MPSEVAEMPTVVTSETLSGIAKQMIRELEKLPLVSHAAVLNIMSTLTQHRQAVEQMLQVKKQNDIGDRQLKLAEAEAARQQSRIISG